MKQLYRDAMTRQLARREKWEAEFKAGEEKRLEREAAERDAIAAMLRASTSEFRPLRRTP